jgi:LuxR family transcriptional regulator, maltose regulon positive regulatory protein
MVAISNQQTFAKLTHPRLYDPLPRKRLFRLLDAMRKEPITWVAAPPGAGKTTLVASYLEARKAPFFWYQLDAGDADPATFFWYLVELARQLERPKKTRLPYLTPEYLSDAPGFARRFFRTLFSWFPRGGVLVLDNCQEVGTPMFYEILAQAAHETPEGLRIVAISRIQPPAELARLKANHQLAELRWEDLKLIEEEAAHILRRKGISESERIAQIHRAADGWAGGLVLLSAHAAPDSETHTITLSAKEAVFDYFAGQVFDRAPKAEQQVLLKTAQLLQVTPEMAVALSGDSSAPKFLDQLYRRQYFTDRRTEPQISYRYHDLFRDFLLHRAEMEFDAAALSALRLQAGRLLLASDEAEPGIGLLCEGGHFSEAQAALLERAASLLGQGRWKTLVESINLFPQAHVRGCAPLMYWRGMAHIAVDPSAARHDLEVSLELCVRAKDALGQLQAIVGIIAAHFVEHISIAVYARWIDPMAALFVQIDAWPVPAIELEARSIFLLAASHLRPEHNLIGPTALRVLALLQDAQIDPNTRAAAGLRALTYFFWTGEAELARRVNAQLETLLVGSDCLAVHAAMGYAFRALYQHLTLEDSQAALLSVQQSLAIAQANGLADSACMALQFQGIVSAGLAFDLDLAESALRNVNKLGFKGSLNRETLYYLVQAHVNKWRGDRAGALRSARLCLSTARANCAAFVVIGGSNLVNVLADAGEYEEAQRLVEEVRTLKQGTCFDNFEAALALEEAYLALQRQDIDLCHERLRLGFRMAQNDPRHAAALHYMGGSNPALFAEALESNIETDYVRALIVRWQVSAPTNAPGNWPWPLSIRTLGKFEIALHGKPIAFGRKSPRKALALLKTLIALGATDVAEQTLTDALWPDEDGDAAHGAYTMALSRLRRLLDNPDLLQQRGAKLSLNRHKCWVDAWAFAQCVQQPNSLATVISLYGGHFLADDLENPWAVSLRERLRSRFSRAISDAANKLEFDGQHEEAAELFQRGLDADDLAEAFYQGLMRCHAATGRTADATATYQKLKQRLSISFGLKPSAVTERLYQSLSGG